MSPVSDAGPTFIEQSRAQVKAFATSAHQMGMELQEQNALLASAHEQAARERDELRDDLDAANARIAELEALVEECARRLAVHGGVAPMSWVIWSLLSAAGGAAGFFARLVWANRRARRAEVAQSRKDIRDALDCDLADPQETALRLGCIADEEPELVELLELVWEVDR